MTGFVNKEVAAKELFLTIPVGYIFSAVDAVSMRQFMQNDLLSPAENFYERMRKWREKHVDIITKGVIIVDGNLAEDDSYVATMEFVDEVAEVLYGVFGRVNIDKVIGRVAVIVVRTYRVYVVRSEPICNHSETLDIVEFFKDTSVHSTMKRARGG